MDGWYGAGDTKSHGFQKSRNNSSILALWTRQVGHTKRAGEVVSSVRSDAYETCFGATVTASCHYHKGGANTGRHAQIEGDGKEKEGRGVTPAQEGSRETATATARRTPPSHHTWVGRARDAVLYNPDQALSIQSSPWLPTGGGH